MMTSHPIRLTSATVAVALSLMYASIALATDVPRKAFRGAISEIGEASLTVQGASERHVFQVVSDTTIVADGNPNAKLSDLKVGDKVDVSYTEEGRTEEGRTLVAHRIESTPSGETVR